MISLRRHNPVLLAKMRAHTDRNDFGGLALLLDGLSVSEFRTAGYLLAEDVLPTLTGEAYWQAFNAIVPRNAKAYLGTFLKAGTALYRKGTLTVSATVLEGFAQTCSAIDERKTLEAFTPCLRTSDEILQLFNLFGHCSTETKLLTLVKTRTLPAFHALFLALRTLDEAEIEKCAAALVHNNDELSFRMVSTLRAYFGLTAVKGTFALHLEDYELSNLELGYASFVKTLTK